MAPQSAAAGTLLTDATVAVSVTGLPAPNGLAPFSLLVTPAPIAGGAVTAVDAAPGGLSTGVYAATAAFTLQARDAFANAAPGAGPWPRWPCSRSTSPAPPGRWACPSAEATAFIPLLAALLAALPAGANSSAWPVALLSAAALQGALEAVPTIGQVRVTAANDSAVAGGSGSGAVVDYSITFVAAAGDVPDLALDLSRSGAGVAVALTSCNAGRVQAVSPAAAPGVATALGGFFALSAGQAWGPGMAAGDRS